MAFLSSWSRARLRLWVFLLCAGTFGMAMANLGAGPAVGGWGAILVISTGIIVYPSLRFLRTILYVVVAWVAAIIVSLFVAAPFGLEF